MSDFYQNVFANNLPGKETLGYIVINVCGVLRDQGY
jgi:hypothetical protein